MTRGAPSEGGDFCLFPAAHTRPPLSARRRRRPPHSARNAHRIPQQIGARPELSRTAEGCAPPALRNALRKHSIFRAPRALSTRLFRRGIPRSPVFPPCPAMASGCALPGICASFEKGLYAAPFPCPKTAPQPANRSAATPAAQRRFDNMPYLPVSG